MNKRTSSIHFLLLLAFVLSGYGFSAELQSARDMKSASYTRGKYLVEQVTLCAECHTPVNERGDPDRTRWLQGAIIDFQPVRQNTSWALESPNIAGLPGWSEADAIKFLETGLDRQGKRARPPMRQYRFSHDDAQAVVTYLRSLDSGDR